MADDKIGEHQQPKLIESLRGPNDAGKLWHLGHHRVASTTWQHSTRTRKTKWRLTSTNSFKIIFLKLMPWRANGGTTMKQVRMTESMTQSPNSNFILKVTMNENSAIISQTSAKTSQIFAKTSQTSAKTSQVSAKTSQASAKTSAPDSSNSQFNTISQLLSACSETALMVAIKQSEDSVEADNAVSSQVRVGGTPCALHSNVNTSELQYIYYCTAGLDATARFAAT